MSILVDDMKQLKLEGVVPRLRNGGGSARSKRLHYEGGRPECYVTLVEKNWEGGIQTSIL